MGSAYRPIATIVRARGTKGELVCRPWHAGSPLLREGLPVAILPPNFSVERFQTVASATFDGSDQRVRFSGIADLDAATHCVGARVLAPEDELPEEAGEEGPRAWIGLLAVDETLGELGRVVDVEEGPAQALLVIAHEGREVLVPAVEPILVSADEEAVHLACPPGLLGI